MLTDDFPKFEATGAECLGSARTASSHIKPVNLGLKQRLLSDVHREVSKKYGLYFEPLNCSKRATVIVDKKGIVKFKKVQQDILKARDNNEILAALKKLS